LLQQFLYSIVHAILSLREFDVPLQLQIASTVNLTHPAAANEACDLERTKVCADIN